MDPVSVLVLTNASLGIARSLAHTVKDLYELAEAYETAALGIRTVATQCSSFRIAVERINKWLVTQNENSKESLDEDFWQALSDNLDTARLVIDDLEKRIKGLKKSPAKFWTRTKYLWNSVVISELQSQIQGLILAVSILIQVIDIPTTGGKRSHSLANRSRLNKITKTVRHNVNQNKARIQGTPEKDLLDDLEQPSPGVGTGPGPGQWAGESVGLQTWNSSNATTTSPGNNTNNGLSRQTTETSYFELAPPPYEPSSTDSRAATAAEASPPISGVKSEGTFKVLSPDEKKAREAKAKKSRFNIFKRSNTPKSESKRSVSDFSDTVTDAKPAQSPEEIKPTAENDTYISIRTNNPSPETSNDYNLQAALIGVSAPHVTRVTPGGLVLDTKEQSQNATGHTSPESTVFEMSVAAATPISPPLGEKPNTNPFRRNGITPRAQSAENTLHTTTSLPLHDRLYSSQRVNSTSESRSTSQDRRPSPARAACTTDSDSLTRLSSLSLSLSHPGSFTEQTWQTTALLNRPSKFIIRYPPDTFTNRISLPAARSLGIADHVIDYAGTPITTLTLLHIVPGAGPDDPPSVVGDEAEFVVMPRHESHRAVIELGEGWGFLRLLMESGDVVYWDPSPVPERLRGVERLRMYRRFELVRW